MQVRMPLLLPDFYPSPILLLSSFNLNLETFPRTSLTFVSADGACAFMSAAMFNRN